MKFVVVGTGGVGGFFGGKLAAAGHDVWFMARGAHLEAMRTNGLRIESTEGGFTLPPGRMTDNPEEIGLADVVLLCVKAYDTEAATRMIAPVLSRSSLIISMQNGVENEELIWRTVSAGMVYGGVVYIYATITAPGVITETGGPKRIIFGPLPDARTAVDARGKSIEHIMREAGITATYTDDIQSALWRKFIFISAVAGLTSLTRLTLGEILAVPETRALLNDAFEETAAVARAQGASFEEGFVGGIFEMLAKRADNNTHSSMYYDLTHGKPLEIEALSGTVVRHGQRLGIPTPVHRAIHAALLPYHLAHARLRGK